MAIIERAKELRRTIENMANQLDDTTALENMELFSEWVVNFSYVPDQKVRYEGALYKCLQAHTSIPTWNPADAVSLWAKVLIPDPEVVPEWEQPGSTNPYMKGDKVRHNDIIWISVIDNNVWEPGVYGWEIIEE